MKESDTIFKDDIENIKQKPFDQNEQAKPKRSKLIRWLLRIFDTIIDLFT